jgi:hypothetical protein
MTMSKRVALSSLLALIVTALVVIPAFATLYVVGEYSGSFSGSGLVNLNPCGSWTCVDANAKFTFLSGSLNSGPNSGVWVPVGAGHTIKSMDWYVFIPSDHTSSNFAAVYYHIPNTTQIAVNQTSWKGSYVTLGTANGNDNSTVWMDNRCVPGFLCNGTMPVYYDEMKFNY